MALFNNNNDNKKKHNRGKKKKKEPHLEARSSSRHRDWTAGASLPTETANTSGMDIREQDRFGYLSHLRGVTNTASTNHVGHPYNPCATHRHTDTHLQYCRCRQNQSEVGHNLQLSQDQQSHNREDLSRQCYRLCPRPSP